MFSFKSRLSGIRNARAYRRSGLEFSDYTLSRGPVPESSWFASPRLHCQVISPGRSGTRWLANIFLETSNALVCHATPKTLAEPGYLLDRNLISHDEALGAYRFSRGDFLATAEHLNRYYIDLDCKVSPLAFALSSAYDKCKFLVMLRDPISFIKSGINRGYFIDKDPRSWGHLDSHPVDLSLPREEWQIYKIASFWRSLATLSDSMLAKFPEKTYVLNTRTMFLSPSDLVSFFAWLEMDTCLIARSKSFSKKANANLFVKPLSRAQQSLLNSNELKSYCLDSLSLRLVESCGLI